MPNILHLQTGMPLHNNVVYNLHHAMLDSGINSKILSMNSERIDTDNVISLKKKNYRVNVILYNLFHRYFIGIFKRRNTYLFSYASVFGNDITKHKDVVSADLIYLHWVVGGFLSLNNIDVLLKMNKKFVFFMHDMWLITGGCHHSFDCTQYKFSCGNCYMLQYQHTLNWANWQLNSKIEILNKYDNYAIITPSAWLYDCVANSTLFKNNHNLLHIPNLVNNSIFKPIDKDFAKKILNLDTNKKYMLFGAVGGVNNPFKGFSYLSEALVILKEQHPLLQIELLIFGSNDEVDSDLPYNTTNLGHIKDEGYMSIICNASDVFVSTSLAESFGLTFLENLLCGTPIVGFDNTAVSEIIDHKINGYLAINKNVEDLAKGIIFCLTNELNFCVNENYQTKNVVNEHKKLIELLMSQNMN